MKWKILIFLPYILFLIMLISIFSQPGRGLGPIVALAGIILLAILYTVILIVALIVRKIWMVRKRKKES
jgi:hypothetical protein